MLDETYYTVEEAAARLRIAPETVRRWLRDGRLPGAKPGGDKAGWRIAAADLAALFRPHGRRAPEVPSVTRGPDRRSAARAAMLAQAERARARGDDEGATRFETMAKAIADGPTR